MVNKRYISFSVNQSVTKTSYVAKLTSPLTKKMAFRESPNRQQEGQEKRSEVATNKLLQKCGPCLSIKFHEFISFLEDFKKKLSKDICCNILINISSVQKKIYTFTSLVFKKNIMIHCDVPLSF